jgi:hypothetical protein
MTNRSGSGNQTQNISTPKTRAQSQTPPEQAANNTSVHFSIVCIVCLVFSFVDRTPSINTTCLSLFSEFVFSDKIAKSMYWPLTILVLLVLQKHVQSQTPPEQAANRPTPSQPVSIYTRQQAEIPMSPSVTFTEPSTSAGINPNDCLWFETNDVSTSVLVWFPDQLLLVICTPRACAVGFSLASSHLCLYSAYSDIQYI